MEAANWFESLGGLKNQGYNYRVRLSKGFC